jgi:hypothetical protein
MVPMKSNARAEIFFADEPTTLPDKKACERKVIFQKQLHFVTLEDGIAGQFQRDQFVF